MTNRERSASVFFSRHAPAQIRVNSLDQQPVRPASTTFTTTTILSELKNTPHPTEDVQSYSTPRVLSSLRPHAAHELDEMAENNTTKSTVMANATLFIQALDFPQKNPKMEAGFFEDGKRQIDFILVYEQETVRANDLKGASRSTDKERQRTFFEKNLMDSGLELEEDTHHHHHHVSSNAGGHQHGHNTVGDHQQGQQHNLAAQKPEAGRSRSANSFGSRDHNTTIFVKVHAPFPVLCKQAEQLKLKMPLKVRDPYEADMLSDQMASSMTADQVRTVWASLLQTVRRLKRKFVGTPNTPTVVEVERMDSEKSGDRLRDNPTVKYGQSGNVTTVFTRKKMDMFAVGDDPPSTFFTQTQRLEMVWELMQKARTDPDDEKRRGVERLLEQRVYDSAFALHDGEYSKHHPAHGGGRPAEAHNGNDPGFTPQRQVLRETWAGWSSAFRRQPLGLIRSYYGEKVAFYFAFLGFYTNMLILPAIFGTCSFFYGVVYAGNGIIVRDICNQTHAPGNFLMCPLCQPPHCQFTTLYSSCENAKWDLRMDNETTLAMACLTVIWATVMLKLWKRREAELACVWDTYDVEQEDDVVRPEFEERAPARRHNPITRELEPYVPPATKLSWILASSCVTLVMLCAVGAALTLVVLARIALYAVFHHLGVHENVELSRWFVHGLIFVIVVIFENMYHRIAHKLTSLECPRTQPEWLNSFLWKVFVFELLNDFVPIAYAAWIKGRSINTPLELSWYSELCDTGGCMSEVTELTAVLLLARLVAGNAAEIGLPWAKFFYARFVQNKIERADSTADVSCATTDHRSKRWHRDYLLSEPELDGVAEEYMEMVVQFAFCTLFVPAFPLAPLVCLLNNIVEIRVDAIKIVTAIRRPLPIRVQGIQQWNDFLNIIAKLAIICNAGLISFTSTVVPRLYYKYAVNGGVSYEKYTQFSMSIIHSVYWPDHVKQALGEKQNLTDCYYEDYRSDVYPYEKVQHWWEVMCMRLAFFALFVLIGFTFEWLFNFVVADVPSCVALKIQRRRYFVAKAMESNEDNHSNGTS